MSERHPSSPQPGQVLGGCRILRQLGKGGMGEVFLADHLALQKKVAVKVLPIAQSGLDEANAIERFLKEARLGASIEHPNVVTILDVGSHRGLYYIVMHYIDGKDLAQLLRENGGPLPWRDAVKLIRLAAKGLHAVHEKGLIHRDIKPSNIMLAEKGRVLLMDFGLVRLEAGPDITFSGQVVGTIPFMSPEQCRNDNLDRRSDVFSLGSTLYNLLTSQFPYQGSWSEMIAQIGGRSSARPACEVCPDVPLEVSNALVKAMHPETDRRYRSAAEFATALRDVLSLRTMTHFKSQGSLDDHAARVPSRGLPEFEIIDALPSSDRREIFHRNLPWIVGAAVFGALLLLGLVVNLLTRHGPARVISAAPQDMIYIEEGFVQLGNTEHEVRAVLEKDLSQFELQVVLANVALEPQRRELVRGFWIDPYEVTNAEYSKFVKDTNYPPPSHFQDGKPPLGKENHPVVNVQYADAVKYAAWAGKKLPTREQWMRAFRGDSRQLYPWGNEYYSGWANDDKNFTFADTSPVEATQRDRSQFGVFNMAGNVSEFIRGEAVQDGVNVHLGKGGNFARTGEVQAIGSTSFVLTPDDLTEFFGFRCIVEGPD